VKPDLRMFKTFKPFKSFKPPPLFLPRDREGGCKEGA